MKNGTQRGVRPGRECSTRPLQEVTEETARVVKEARQLIDHTQKSTADLRRMLFHSIRAVEESRELLKRLVQEEESADQAPDDEEAS